MLDRLAIPPRLLLRALDDLHAIATQLPDLVAAARVLPEVEDRLSERIAELRGDVAALQEWLRPLHTELTDLDETAEALQTALAKTDATIAALHAEIKDLRDRIPGI
jgi:chromosome segregation ATPase